MAARAFPGNVVEFAIRDPRIGPLLRVRDVRALRPARDAHDGPDAASGSPRPASGTPRGATGSWSGSGRSSRVKPTALMYAGVAPAALFTSTDGGMTWELNRAMYDQPSRSSWQPGAGGLCLHSIATWPGDPSRLAIGISAVGVWLSDDGGASWRHGNAGLVPRLRSRRRPGRTRSTCASTTCTGRPSGRSGSSCSSTAASTAATTPARAGPRSRRDSRRTSASRW